MSARHEVERQRQRLDEAFSRIASIDADALEARADFAKYLCVRVSGFLESAITLHLAEHARGTSAPRISHYVGRRLGYFQNAKKDKILDLFGEFDPEWRADLERFLVDEMADALGTIVANRHKIAHGDDSTITYARVREHWLTIQQIVNHIADLVDPPGG